MYLVKTRNSDTFFAVHATLIEEGDKLIDFRTDSYELSAIFNKDEVDFIISVDSIEEANKIKETYERHELCTW